MPLFPKYDCFLFPLVQLEIKLILGMVGEIDSSTTPPNYRLFTHKKLEIGYNGKQVGHNLFLVSLIILGI